MPAFTFEKISSPIRRTTPPVVITGNSEQVSTKRSRGLIFDMMDRLISARTEREAAEAPSESPAKRHPPD